MNKVQLIILTGLLAVTGAGCTTFKSTADGTAAAAPLMIGPVHSGFGRMEEIEEFSDGSESSVTSQSTGPHQHSVTIITAQKKRIGRAVNEHMYNDNIVFRAERVVLHWNALCFLGCGEETAKAYAEIKVYAPKK